MLEPILEQLATEYKGKVTVAHVDVDQAQSSASKFRIMSVPTMIFMKDGKPVDQHIGLLPKDQLKKKFDSLLA
jgi:thioredoxin 1